MAHVITILFPNGLCSRITTVGLIINLTVQSSSGKIKTYINILDIELLALTKSPLTLGIDSDNTTVIVSSSVTYLPAMTVGWQWQLLTPKETVFITCVRYTDNNTGVNEQY